jgi:bidirectional [NiFe] hydrogenase diaphorase subunit
MSAITLEIDHQQVVAEEGTTLLEAARQVGIEIPTMCHDDRVKPSGACRMCLVEIAKGERRRLVASCSYPVEDGLVVTTENERLIEIRKLLIELLWPSWTRMAARYGVTYSRFEHPQSDCSLCGLCVRYCSDVAKKDVVYFRGRGIDRELAFVPGSELECGSCRECFDLCTGGWLVTHQGAS